MSSGFGLADLIRVFPKLSDKSQQDILNRPAFTAPEGEHSNLTNPPNGNNLALIILIVGIIPVTILGGLRLYARIWLAKTFRIEDWLGFAAFAPFCAGAWKYYEFLEVGGYLTHQWNMRLRDFLGMLRILVHLRVCHGLVMLLAKTAIVIEWTRIFVPPGVRNWFFYASMSVLTLNTLIYTVSLLIIPAACIPTHKIWQPWVPGRCLDRKLSDIASAWCNLGADIILLILPQTVIWKLQMPKSNKIGVSLMFSIGLLVAVAAAARIWSNTSIDYAGDTAYDASIVTMVSWAELVGVMIVFFAMGTPRAITGLKQSFGMVASRSWTKIQGKKGPTRSERSWGNGRRGRFYEDRTDDSTEMGFVRTEIQAGNSNPEDEIFQGSVCKTVTVQRRVEYVRFGSTEKFLTRNKENHATYGVDISATGPFGPESSSPSRPYRELSHPDAYGRIKRTGSYSEAKSQASYSPVSQG